MCVRHAQVRGTRRARAGTPTGVHPRPHPRTAIARFGASRCVQVTKISGPEFLGACRFRRVPRRQLGETPPRVASALRAVWLPGPATSGRVATRSCSRERWLAGAHRPHDVPIAGAVDDLTCLAAELLNMTAAACTRMGRALRRRVVPGVMQRLL